MVVFISTLTTSPFSVKCTLSPLIALLENKGFTTVHGKITDAWQTNDIRVHTSDIRVTYKYIRVTSGWHTSSYEWYTDDIRVHTSDMRIASANHGARGEHLTSQPLWAAAWVSVTVVCPVYLVD